MGLGVYLYQGSFLSACIQGLARKHPFLKPNSSEAIGKIDSTSKAARILMTSYFLPRSHLLKLARMVSLADSSPQPGAYYSSAPCSLPKASRILIEPRIVMEMNHHLAFHSSRKDTVPYTWPITFQY